MRTINLNNQKKIANPKIAILFMSLLMIVLSMSFKGNIIIKGKVVDESNLVLSGVNVMVKGTSINTVTDLHGNYQINVSNGNSILIFSLAGYQSQEISTSGKTQINVVLKEELESLKEDDLTLTNLIATSPKTRSIAGGLFKSKKESESAFAPASVTYFNPSTESYSKINENGFRSTKSNPLSTFSIDVDRASYSNIRRFINEGQLPHADAVKIEEMINYFEYDYPQPVDEHPFSINTEYAECPWQSDHKLLHIGLQGKKIAADNLPPSNLVFLLDVSGSMDEPNKLPLVKSAFRLLVNNLREKDKVAIVVYAGAAGLVLPSTKGSQKDRILDALDGLQAGGSTAGCQGITLAYKVAEENFIKEGNNRVILATDGDFNVGISNDNELEDFIVDKRKTGIFLSCLGFGMGNYKDSKMEILADKGNGNYNYINDLMEANKVFVNEFGGTLFTIAKDVKIQIEFNPSLVQAYRLVGYENRLLNNEDFKDDTKDAGELGSGHTVTAIYEIIPAGVKSKYVPDVDELKYQNKNTDDNRELATVKFRYKKPDGEKSIEMIHPISNKAGKFENASTNLKFSSAVAMFGMMLRNSEFKGSSTMQNIIEIANNSKGKDNDGYRGEFVRMVKMAQNFNLSAEK